MIEANAPFCQQPVECIVRVGHGAQVICDVFLVSLLRDLSDLPQPRGGIPRVLSVRAGAVR